MNMLQTRLGLKTRLGLYLGLTMSKNKNFKIFFQEIKPTTLLFQHVKGQPAAATYVRKRGVAFHTNRGTPSSKIFSLRFEFGERKREIIRLFNFIDL